MTEQIKPKRTRRAKITTEDNSIVELPAPIKKTKRKSTKQIILDVVAEAKKKEIEAKAATTDSEKETEVGVGKSTNSAQSETESLRKLFNSLLLYALEGDTKSADIIIKISSELAKREGSYAPTKTHTKVEGELKVEQETKYDFSKASLDDLIKMNSMLEQLKVPE